MNEQIKAFFPNFCRLLTIICSWGITCLSSVICVIIIMMFLKNHRHFCREIGCKCYRDRDENMNSTIKSMKMSIKWSMPWHYRTKSSATLFEQCKVMRSSEKVRKWKERYQRQWPSILQSKWDISGSGVLLGVESYCEVVTETESTDYKGNKAWVSESDQYPG